jgi:hypothetical protein
MYTKEETDCLYDVNVIEIKMSKDKELKKKVKIRKSARTKKYDVNFY